MVLGNPETMDIRTVETVPSRRELDERFANA